MGISNSSRNFFLEKKKKMVRRRVGWSTPPLPLISLSFVGLRGKKSGLTPTLQQMGGFWAGEQETPPHLCRFRIVLKKFFFGKKEKNGEKASWGSNPTFFPANRRKIGRSGGGEGSTTQLAFSPFFSFFPKKNFFRTIRNRHKCGGVSCSPAQKPPIC